MTWMEWHDNQRIEDRKESVANAIEDIRNDVRTSAGFYCGQCFESAADDANEGKCRSCGSLYSVVCIEQGATMEEIRERLSEGYTG